MANSKEKNSRGPYSRGLEKRRVILEAVLRLVSREGVSAVTHRAVAAEASTSLRSTTYYFATKDDMIREAFRFFAERSVARIDATARAARDHRLDVDAAIKRIVDQLSSEHADPNTSWTTEFELILTIARRPSFAPEYHQFQVRLDHHLRRALAELGSKSPARHARIVLGFLRGFELAHLSRPNQAFKDGGLRGDLRHLLTLLIDQDPK